MRSCPFQGGAMADTPQRNFILSRLAPGDSDLLQPHLVPVDLPVRKVLEHRGRRITNVYFSDRGGGPRFPPPIARGLDRG